MYISKCEHCENEYDCEIKENYQNLEKQWRENYDRDYFIIKCLKYIYKDY